jgi:hypothetical protein
MIAVEGGAKSLTCEGETIVVNLHGALIATALGLSVGMRISILVYLTDKRAKGRIVYVDSDNALRCGIELDQPRNIWGVPLPPNDWDETVSWRRGLLGSESTKLISSIFRMFLTRDGL